VDIEILFLLFEEYGVDLVVVRYSHWFD